MVRTGVPGEVRFRRALLRGVSLLVLLTVTPVAARAGDAVRSFPLPGSLERALRQARGSASEQFRLLRDAGAVDSLLAGAVAGGARPPVACFHSCLGGEPALFDLARGTELEAVTAPGRIAVFWLDDQPAVARQVGVKANYADFRKGYLEDLKGLHGGVGKFARPVRSEDAESDWALCVRVFEVRRVPCELTLTFRRLGRLPATEGLAEAGNLDDLVAIDGGSAYVLHHEAAKLMIWDREWFGFGLSVGAASVNRRLIDLDPGDPNVVVVRRNVLRDWKGGGMVTAFVHPYRDRGWSAPVAFWKRSSYVDLQKRLSLQAGIALSDRPFDRLLLGAGFLLHNGFDAVVGCTWTRTDAPESPKRVPASVVSGFGDLDAQLPERYEPQWFVGLTVHGRAIGAALGK